MSLTLGSIINGTEDGERKPTDGDSGGTDGDSSTVKSDETGAREPKTIAGYPVVSPIEWITGNESTNATPKRRGRPPGSKNRESGVSTTPARSTEKASQNLTDLDGLILSAHLMCAKVLSIPELELDEKESEKLASSIRNLAKHYTAVFDPKKIAMFELACCAGSIYGPRAVALYKRSADNPRPAKIRESRPTPPETSAVSSDVKVSLSDLSPSQIWQEGG